MVKIDEQFIKEKINPVVGFIFHTARQLGADNAPNLMDMEHLRQGTERVKALIEDFAALASPRRDEWVPMETEADLPKESGQYVWKVRGQESHVATYYPVDAGNKPFYLERFEAYMPIPPYKQGGSE